MRLTCQICQRAIEANTGRIALHGFTRPMPGWQTGSCFGARHLPLEASRDRLGEYTQAIQGSLEGTQGRRGEVTTERAAAVFLYRTRSFGKSESHRREVTRKTFPEVYQELNPHFIRESTHSFDKLKERHLNRLDADIRQLQTELTRARMVYDGWTQTLAWGNQAWRAA